MTYFKRDEFACKCGCGFDTVDFELYALLNKLREHFDVPITVTSGCRCPAHNKKHFGAPKSQHLLGRAADIKVKGIGPQLVAEAAAQYGATGIKAYTTFTHVDTRSGMVWRA